MCKLSLSLLERADVDFSDQHLDLTPEESMQLTQDLTEQARRLEIRMDGYFDRTRIREAFSTYLREHADEMRSFPLIRVKSTVVVGVYRKLCEEAGETVVAPTTRLPRALDTEAVQRAKRYIQEG